jgi:hypothetical protein
MVTRVFTHGGPREGRYVTTERCPPPDDAERDTDAGQGPPVSFAARLEHLVDLGHAEEVAAAPALRETDELRQLLHELKLPDWETLHARAAARDPGATTQEADGLRLFLHRLLMVSKRLSLAHSHGEFSAAEREKIRTMARALEIDDAQTDALEEYYRRFQVRR